MAASGVRIKDIARVQGQRQHSIVGYGIVSGLAGTGDSATNRATRQSIANTLSQFNVTVPPEAVRSFTVPTTPMQNSLRSWSASVCAVAPRPLKAAIRAPWREDMALREAIKSLRERGETVVGMLPGHESEIDEFHCDRELVAVSGQWVVKNIENQ